MTTGRQGRGRREHRTVGAIVGIAAGFLYGRRRRPRGPVDAVRDERRRRTQERAVANGIRPVTGNVTVGPRRKP